MGAGGVDADDVNLPKATVAKIVQGELSPLLLYEDRTDSRAPPLRPQTELLPADFSCAKEAKDLMTEMCKGSYLSVSCRFAHRTA